MGVNGKLTSYSMEANMQGHAKRSHQYHHVNDRAMAAIRGPPTRRQQLQGRQQPQKTGKRTMAIQGRTRVFIMTKTHWVGSKHDARNHCAVALATKAPGKTMIVQEGQEAHLARMYRLHAGTTMTTMMTVRVSFPKSLFDHSDEIACARL